MCIAGYLAASLVSTHYVPPSYDNQKHLQLFLTAHFHIGSLSFSPSSVQFYSLINYECAGLCFLRNPVFPRKVCGLYIAREIPKPIKPQATISAFFSLTEIPQWQQNKIKTYCHCFLTHHVSKPITNNKFQNKKSQITFLY